MKILIVSAYFPPLNRVASLRTRAWAKYWSRAGHEVTVLTTAKTEADGLLDLEVDGETARAIEVVETPYFSLRRLKGAGGGGGSSAAGRAGPRSLLRRFTRFTGLNPLSPHLWTGRAYRRGKELLKGRDFDIVVSTYGPPASPVVASMLKKRFPLLWVADYRDLWNDGSLLVGKWPFSSLERQIENRVMAGADLITTVSEAWTKLLGKRFGKKVVTVSNGFDAGDGAGLDPSSPFPDDGRRRLVYTGTYYPERQSPEPLFRALAVLREEGLPLEKRLEVLFYGVKESALGPLTEQYGLGGVVRAVGYVERREVLRVQRSADLLIYLDWLDPSFAGEIAAKIYEYLHAGRPVICLGDDPGTEAARLVRSSGAGFAPAGSQEEILAALRRLLRGEGLPFAATPEALARCTRESRSMKMLRAMEELLAARGRE